MSAKYDQHLACADCNHDFMWSVREQEFYREEGFQPSKRCRRESSVTKLYVCYRTEGDMRRR